MTDTTKPSGKIFRRFISKYDWRRSETMLVSGVFTMGLIILIVHISTWGRDLRHDAKHMRTCVCRVLERDVAERVQADGTTKFRPEAKIRYQYSSDEGSPKKKYEIWTFERATLSPDQGFYYDRKDAERELQRFKDGQDYICWVYDDNPAVAVLMKPSYFWGWVFLIIPISLILFGGSWLCVRIRERMRSKEEQANLRKQETLYPNVPIVPDESGVVLPKRLKSDIKFSFAFKAALTGVLAWNVASWVALTFVFIDAKTTFEYVSSSLFGAIFCGAGFLFGCRFWRMYLVNRVVGSSSLEISSNPIAPGRKIKICLFLYGRIEAKRLDLLVRCEEVARYVQGTNSICHRHEVCSHPILTKYGVDVASKSEERVEASFCLPLAAPHSFVAEHNEISWTIVMKMEFADGETYERAFDVAVRPYLGSRYN